MGICLTSNHIQLSPINMNWTSLWSWMLGDDHGHYRGPAWLLGRRYSQNRQRVSLQNGETSSVTSTLVFLLVSELWECSCSAHFTEDSSGPAKYPRMHFTRNSRDRTASRSRESNLRCSNSQNSGVQTWLKLLLCYSISNLVLLLVIVHKHLKPRLRRFDSGIRRTSSSSWNIFACLLTPLYTICCVWYKLYCMCCMLCSSIHTRAVSRTSAMVLCCQNLTPGFIPGD